jgi:type IV secretory pathway TrbD component
VSTDQIMILTNAVLVAVLGFMIRMWISDLKTTIRDITGKLEKKVDKDICDTFHNQIRPKLHSHAHVGTAGEVVI